MTSAAVQPQDPAARRSRRRHTPIIGAAVLFTVTALTLGVLRIAAPATADSSLLEGNLIEAVSPPFWFLAAAAALVGAYRRRRARTDLLLFVVVMAAMGFRELDFHKLIYDWSITRFINYTKDYIPLTQRLIAFFLIIVPVAGSLLALLVRGLRRFPEGWRRGAEWPVYVIQWFALLIPSMTMDKLSGVIERSGIRWEWAMFFVVSAEEALELTLAFFSFLIFALIALRAEPSRVSVGEGE